MRGQKACQYTNAVYPSVVNVSCSETGIIMSSMLHVQQSKLKWRCNVLWQLSFLHTTRHITTIHFTRRIVHMQSCPLADHNWEVHLFTSTYSYYTSNIFLPFGPQINYCHLTLCHCSIGFFLLKEPRDLSINNHKSDKIGRKKNCWSWWDLEMWIISAPIVSHLSQVFSSQRVAKEIYTINYLSHNINIFHNYFRFINFVSHF